MKARGRNAEKFTSTHINAQSSNVNTVTEDDICVGLGNISVLYHDMRQDIVTDFGFRYIVMWCKCCLLLVERLHYNKVM